jgi:tetratricopeptide (TPR) repeat protein
MKRLIFAGLFVLILQFGIFAQNKDFDLGLKAAGGGDFQTALQHFKKAQDQNPSGKKLAQIHYNIGVCFYQLKYLANASSEFEQAVGLDPNYEKAFYALGMTEAELQNWYRAETVFQQTLKLSDGRNGEVWFDLAFVYVGQRKYDEAFASFQNAIKFGSKSAAAGHNNLGVIYAIKGNLQRAGDEIEMAKDLGYQGAENNLAVLRRFIETNDKSLIANLILR